jgi:hypothetical protein
MLVCAGLVAAAGIAGLEGRVAPASAADKAAEKAPKGRDVDEKADARLRDMSNYLASLHDFSFVADHTTEVVLKTGEKLDFGAQSKVSIRRPDRLRSDRVGELATGSFFYDGKTATILGKKENLYASADAPKTLNETLDFLDEQLDIEVPAGDLLRDNVYEGLIQDVKEGRYVADVMVDDVRCDHLAFRGKDVDWQIWIEQGNRPLPRKYVITDPKAPSVPEYTVTTRDWNTNVPLPDSTFTFVPPPGSKKIAFLKDRAALKNKMIHDSKAGQK